MSAQDLESLAKSLDDRFNARDEEGVLDYFADDVVIQVTPPPPPPLLETSHGKEQARQFVRALLPGFLGESSNHRVEGDRVTWDFSVSADAFRQMGLENATGTVEAIVQQGKIKRFNPMFDVETVTRILMGGRS